MRVPLICKLSLLALPALLCAALALLVVWHRVADRAEASSPSAGTTAPAMTGMPPSNRSTPKQRWSRQPG